LRGWAHKAVFLPRFGRGLEPHHVVLLDTDSRKRNFNDEERETDYFKQCRRSYDTADWVEGALPNEVFQVVCSCPVPIAIINRAIIVHLELVYTSIPTLSCAQRADYFIPSDGYKRWFPSDRYHASLNNGPS